MAIQFLKPLRLPEHLVDGENLKIGYGDKVVLSGVSFSIRSGERIGILGVNGAGKSTLVKAIVGELTPMSGELRRGQGLEIGYFAQHQLDQLRMDETPLEHLRHLAPDVREQELRDFLGTYRFSGDFAEAKVAPMSGGEKARLALALIAWKNPICWCLTNRPITSTWKHAKHSPWRFQPTKAQCFSSPTTAICCGP